MHIRIAGGAALIAGLVMVSVSLAGADEPSRDERVYAYDDAGYYYWLDHGFVFEHPAADRGAGSLVLTALGPESGAASIEAHRRQVGVEATAARISTPDAMSTWKASGGAGLDTGDAVELWSAGGTLTILETRSWYVRAFGGASGVRATEHVLGAAAGLRATRAVSPSLDLTGAVTGYAIGAGDSAVEAAIGVRAWVLRAGYRVVSVREVTLGGPEVGIAVTW